MVEKRDRIPRLHLSGNPLNTMGATPHVTNNAQIDYITFTDTAHILVMFTNVLPRKQQLYDNLLFIMQFFRDGTVTD